MDDLPSDTAPVTVTVNSIALTGSELACLAREMVMDIFPAATVLDHFKVTPEQYEQLKEHVDFKRFYEQASIEWNSALSTPERLKVQAAAYLEATLPKIAGRMHKDAEALPAVIEGGKLLAKIAGVGENNGIKTTGEKFEININLGGDDSIRIEKTITPSDQAAALRTLTERPSDETVMVAIPERPRDDGALPQDQHESGNSSPLQSIPQGA